MGDLPRPSNAPSSRALKTTFGSRNERSTLLGGGEGSVSSFGAVGLLEVATLPLELEAVSEEAGSRIGLWSGHSTNCAISTRVKGPLR